MNVPSPRRIVLRCFLFVALSLGFFGVSPAQAQTPDEQTRPYLELPFAGGTSYDVTCGYGCYQHTGSMSYAVDFLIPEGDPILAAAGGTVMAITWEIGLPLSLNLGDALIVYIDHGNNWFTRYIHLSGVTVTVGDTVQMGHVIGYSGKSGASGDHLHFELKYGTSLHSASLPIDELFGGMAPEAGTSYLSNNYAITDLPAPTPREATPTVLVQQPDPLPAPTESPAEPLTSPVMGEAFADYLPQVAGGIALSSETVRAGEPLTATFTIHNTSSERMHLSMLGVAAQPVGTASPSEATLFFDRSIILNPGRSYRFERAHTFDEAGDMEMFVFALGPNNEWLPLSGSVQRTPFRVEAGTASLFLPLLLGPPSSEQEVPFAPARPADLRERERVVSERVLR